MANREREQLSLDLFVALSRASKVLMEENSKKIDSYGVNATEFAVLELLFHKGEQPIQKIGQKILLQSGSMTYVINQLEKKGLLERQRCPVDKRVFYAKNTEKGNELISNVFPEHKQMITELMSVLSEEELVEMTLQLKKLGKSIRTL